MVHRTDDLAQARAAMARALEWQHHLFKAGAYKAAGEIVTAVWDILARWGERDRTKALLHGSIATLEGPNKAVAQGNLAALLMEEVQLDEALATYQEVYRTFEAMEKRRDMAAVLNQQSIIYDMMGRYDDAVATGERGLKLIRELGDEEGQAIVLHQLSIFYLDKGDYATALARSEEAEKLNRRLHREAGIATNLHQQGLMLTNLACTAHTNKERITHLSAAFERFQQSLVIARRIGHEPGIANCLGELGKLLRDAGQMGEAIAAFTEALDIFTRMGNPTRTGFALQDLGIVHELQGQHAAALEKYQQALNILERVGAVREAEINRRHIGRVQAKLRGE
jgi:tetratricopeptide (TPR) repeat protein